MPVARADNENANENENGKTGKCGKHFSDKHFFFFGSATKQTPVKP